MAVEGSEEVFTKWLTKKLKSLDVEDEVLASYISGVITTDDVDMDKHDILQDILQDLVVQGVDTLCGEILEEWARCQKNNTQLIQREEEGRCVDFGERVSLMVGRSVRPVVKANDRSREEEEVRAAVLARCNYATDDEEEECESEEGASNPSNAECVAAAERARRERLKAESQEKRAQDKGNREKQRAKQEERREKERKRTQKGERRR